MAAPDPDIILELLTRLVAAESVNPPGNEDRATAVLAEFLERHGIQFRIDPVQPHRPNLIATVGKGSPRILLTSHLDVVDPGESARWDHDPFTAHIEEGTLFGRGACDAKGQIAGMIGALVALATDPPCQVVLAAVMGEEKGGLGSKHFAARDGRFDAAIVGEPAQLGIATGHAGRVGITLHLIGEASHPTRADSGSNPVFHLPEVITFLSDFAAQVRQEKLGSVVVLEVHAGKTNVLTPPQRVTLCVSWWFASQMTHDDAIDRFRSRFDDLGSRRGFAYEMAFHRGAGAYEIASDHPLISIARRAVESVTGTPPIVAPFPASCDMYIFGREGIPTIIFGPGALSLAHAPNESIRLQDVFDAARIYVEIINAYCKE